MKKSYTPKANKVQATISAPMYCGVITPPQEAAARGVTYRQIVSVACLFHKDTNGIEVLHIFGEASFVDACNKQAEDKKKEMGEAFDGNYLLPMAQCGFYKFYANKEAKGEPAMLYCWVDCVDPDKKTPATYEFEHRLVLRDENGKFNANAPVLAWNDPKENPLTIVNARKDVQKFILNKLYAEYEEEIWTVSEYHPDAVRFKERKVQAQEPSFAESMFGVAAPKPEPIKHAVTKLDNQTKQIINNLLRKEKGIEVVLDKNEGVLKIKDCGAVKRKVERKEGSEINSVGQAFAAIA